MSEQSIRLKPVYELRVDGDGNPFCYFIPAYQRGFRWTTTQVIQLLEDIRNFTRRDRPQPEEFYCLQPLVLLAKNDRLYEVVDGQQRLTTLLLILRHFNARQAVKYQLGLYRIEYETRPSLDGFLESPSESKAVANIDFFHLYEAIKAIEGWFEEHESEVDVMKDAFLNKTKIIWFELSPEENPVAAFTRLNVGKIQLTNGELIRALFLRMTKGGNDETTQLRVAYEWDLVEKALQVPDFWSFLSNEMEGTGGRIDFLFDLVARQQGMKRTFDGYDYATFNHFADRMARKGVDPEAEWLIVKKTFMLLEEWFIDRRLFHMVGFLVWEGIDLNILLGSAANTTKETFRNGLRERILGRAFGTVTAPARNTPQFREYIADGLDALEYGAASRQVRAALLLFNLATLLLNADSNIRFQFDSFKTKKWDIEHVRSNAPDRPGGRKGQGEWLDRCLGYLKIANEAPELRSAIEVYMAQDAKTLTDVDFEKIYEQVLRHFHEAGADEPNNGLANLVLLDAATNRSYKNAVFAVKRHRVLSLDRDGIFVPLCTRNVFLKCYNPQVGHVMFWTEKDQDGYRAAMIEVLYEFFKGGWIHD